MIISLRFDVGGLSPLQKSFSTQTIMVSVTVSLSLRSTLVIFSPRP